MNPSRPKLPLWLRAAYFFLGAGLLFWLPVEDTGLWRVVLFSAGFVLLALPHLWFRLATRPCKGIWTRYTISSMILGMAFPLLTISLMIFKNGLHAHGFPDYYIEDLAHIFGWTPWTAAVGGLSGLAAGYYRQRDCPKET